MRLSLYPSRSAALNSEEAESALEATHYFTEDSSSEVSGSLRLPAGGLGALGCPERGLKLGPTLASCSQVSLWAGSDLTPVSLVSVFLDLGSSSLCPPAPMLSSQHLLWPLIGIFSCPGRLKVSARSTGRLPWLWVAASPHTPIPTPVPRPPGLVDSTTGTCVLLWGG